MSYGEGEPRKADEVSCDVCDNIGHPALFRKVCCEGRGWYYCDDCNRNLIDFYPPADQLGVRDKIALHKNMLAMADMTISSLKAKATTHTRKLAGVV